MIDKLVLGTVQFGMDYGVNNHVGKPHDDTVLEIFQLCYDRGIRYLDTAADYGNSEERIGQLARKGEFRIISKFSKLPGSSWKNSLEKTIAYLDGHTIQAILFHSFDEYLRYANEVDEIIEVLQSKGIEGLGVSLYTNAEIEKVLEDDRISAVQLPYNLLDNYSFRGNALRALKRQGKKIYTRSAFLQGVFFLANDNFPPVLEPLKPALGQIRQMASHNNIEVGQLALNYCLQQPEIDGVLIGVDSAAQLLQNIAWAEHKIAPEINDKINSISVKESSLLNPANWNK